MQEPGCTGQVPKAAHGLPRGPCIRPLRMMSRLVSFEKSFFERPPVPKAPPQRSRWAARLQALRHLWWRRVVLAVALGVFLPVVSATMACQIDCVFSALHPADTTAGQSTLHVATGHETVDAGFEHSQHLGPCHLGFMTSVASDTREDLAQAPRFWHVMPSALVRSCVWPPPRHPPRT